MSADTEDKTEEHKTSRHIRALDTLFPDVVLGRMSGPQREAYRTVCKALGVVAIGDSGRHAPDPQAETPLLDCLRELSDRHDMPPEALRRIAAAIAMDAGRPIVEEPFFTPEQIRKMVGVPDPSDSADTTT